MDENFEKRFQLLDFLSANADTLEEFNEKYEVLLNAVKAFQGPRFEKALRLKALQIKQGFFLCALSEIARIEEGIEEHGNVQ